jgi:hypothetical protein
MDNQDEIHKIWYDFCDYMKEWYYKEVDEYEDGVKTGNIVKFFDTAKMMGDECLNRVDYYAKKHKEIKIVDVDDDTFCGASLVLIPHPKFGMTVIFIPQCTGVNNMFFLYSHHLQELQETLNDMSDKYSGFEHDFLE